MENIIFSIRDFSKSFRSEWSFQKKEKVVKDVSLDIIEGECFGFIGHNGAGKTTTIKSILGLIKKDSGEFLFKGSKINQKFFHSKIGYLPEEPYFYEHLTVYETLDFFASLFNLRGDKKKERINYLLNKLSLDFKRKEPVKSLSKGLKQKLGICCAILNEPELLFLDEPFSGLDPIGRKEIRELIVELNKKHNTTIFMSSHILSDVQDICDRVSILKRGELKKIVNISEIKDSKSLEDIFVETIEN